jgi:hypothetical protein
MKHLLSSSAFLVVNKSLAKQIGLNETVLLADLISKEEYFIENNQLKDGWFFNTSKNIENDTTLTSHQQRKAIKKLADLEIIEVKLIGIPAKQHFKVHELRLLEFLQTSCENNANKLLKNRKLVVKKPQTINKNKVIRITNKDIYNRKEKFILEVSSFDYDKSVLDDFVDYWTEPSKSGMLRFEMQKTWSTNLRLKNWAKNSKRWSNPKSAGMSKLDAQINSWQEAKKLI